MKVLGEYRFSGAGSTTVRVTDIYWKGFHRNVKFVTLHNGKPVGETREVLYSYARKHWTYVG